MAKTLIFSPHIAHRSSSNPSSPHFNHQLHHRPRRDFSLLASASSLPLPINADYLAREFSSHGVSFEGIGESCAVKMGLENGSVANLLLPSGLITSYKPLMWHGSTVEVLHTSVFEADDGEVVVQGGVSLGFNCRIGGELSWSPSSWALHDVRGSSCNSVQVELKSVDPKGMIEFKYLVTLQEDSLYSELTISNLKSNSLQLMGSIFSHLTVSTPDATYAVGLQGSNYLNMPPLKSGFNIIPPHLNRKRPSGSNQSWAQKMLQGWRQDEDTSDKENETEESEGEEGDNYAQMTEKMSRIYTSTPREFTVIDRGRRNSVVIERRGFEEVYLFSPGSNHEWYGKYAFVCMGPSAVLKPLALSLGDVWRGGQYLHNPNL